MKKLTIILLFGLLATAAFGLEAEQSVKPVREEREPTFTMRIIDVSFRLMAGIDMKFNLTEKKRLSVGAGLDLNASMPFSFDMGVGVVRPWVYTQHLSIGPFVRIKAKI
jgi:hypothetical protein